MLPLVSPLPLHTAPASPPPPSAHTTNPPPAAALARTKCAPVEPRGARTYGPTLHHTYGPTQHRTYGPTLHHTYGPKLHRTYRPTLHRTYGPTLHCTYNLTQHGMYNLTLQSACIHRTSCKHEESLQLQTSLFIIMQLTDDQLKTFFSTACWRLQLGVR